jgi:hypothetical protein
MYGRFCSFLAADAFFLALNEEVSTSVFRKGQRPLLVAVEGGGVLVLDVAAGEPFIKGRGRGLPRPLMPAQSWKRGWPVMQRH